MPAAHIVFLPGLACDARLYEAQRAALPAGCAGEVSDAHTRHDSIEAMAAAVLREHAGPLILIGASMGGMVAMEAARQAPERIAGLALLGSSARPETPEMLRLRGAAIGLFREGRAREVIEFNAPFAFHPVQARDATMVRRYVAMVLDAGVDPLIRQNRAVMARPDARVHLPRMRCPLLLLCGDADQLTPPECTREIAALAPHAELALLPQCGHMLTMEKPAQVNATLRPWLERLLQH